jgi:protein-disulfide isomerase
MRNYATGVAIFASAALAACGSPDDLREIRDGQRELRAKLGDIEKKGGSDRVATAAAAPGAADPNRVFNIPIADSPVKGAAAAKVTLLEFSDFQCPFCSQVPPVVDEVLKAYPTDVKFVFKQFPLVRIHPQATPAAKAALAAHKQGKFWEMHDKLFANQKALDAESLKKYAQEVGLDVAKWETDKESPEVAKQIDEESKLAATVQVTGTPSLFINGKKVSNRTFDGLKGMIDEALKKG